MMVTFLKNSWRLAWLAALFATTASAETTLLNASYDVTREFYKDYNVLFQNYWKQKTGQDVTVKQSHGGSSKQARAVADGLEADVVTMNQSIDIDFLAEKKLVAADWAKRLPNNSAPTTSTIVFLVREGNPKRIKDWDDLVKPGIRVIIPNPKTSGNGRYTYLAAWTYALKHGGNEAKAIDFETQLFKNVPVLDTGGRGATTTFAQRGIGDVLVTFESEVISINKELEGEGKVDVVYPSLSLLAENPVAVVDRVVDRRKTRAEATAYLEYLYSDEAQALAAKHYLRPRSAKILAQNAASFKAIPLFTVDEVFGSLKAAQKTHFDDGGQFDKIFSAIGKN
jgi:sulfate transport system substrate-binding protein